MITGNLVFLAIQYLDPDQVPPHVPDTKQEIDEGDISQADVLRAIQYLDRDGEKPDETKPQADTDVSQVIQYLDPDLDQQPTLFKLQWLPRWIWRLW